MQIDSVNLRVCVKLYIDMSNKCNFIDKYNDMNRFSLSMNLFRHLKTMRSEAMKIDTI